MMFRAAAAAAVPCNGQYPLTPMPEAPLPPSPPLSRRANAGHYILYFAAMGIYLPYFNLYCYHLGFSGFEIGVLSALRALAMVVFPAAWGALADRLDGRRPIYIGCTAMSAGIWSGFLFTEDFRVMAVLTGLYGMFYAPIIAFLEALTLESLGGRRQRYGSVRAWGSASFIGVVLLYGRLVEIFPLRLIVASILALSIALAALALRLPAPAAAPRGPATARTFAWLTGPALAFFACGFLMLASHGAYYGFFSIHLERLGHSRTFIGLAWALASTAEIGVMVLSGRLFGRFSLERVLAVSIAAAVLRWAVLGAAASPAAILLAQGLHALTYGTFHMASVLFVDRLTPPSAKNLGQALNNALTYGLGLTVGFFANGALFGTLDTFGLFRSSAAVALLAGAMLALLCRSQSRREGEKR